MTSSSVIGTAVAFHLFDSPRPINSRRHNNNNLLFFTPPSASTSSSRFNRHAETSHHHHHRHVNSRWIHSGVFLQSGSFKQARLRKRYASSAYQISEFSAAVRQRQVLCFRANNRRGSYLDTCLPGFFNDKSKFCLSKKALSLDHGFKVKAVGIPRASMGPVEPHAASTASASDFLLEEGLESNLEKIGLDLFLRSELPSHPKLYRGKLKNGLCYRILPNKVPPNRFKAHMEVHAGSIDEEDDEQGIAHMIEHVAFLGSKKREKLLSTGARSNAYTDFHHTVFHIHSPTTSKARRTLLMRHEAEIKSNAYWLGLLAHLQSSSVPRKDISCIKDLTSLYEAATVDDVYTAYGKLKIDDNSLYSIVGITGSQTAEEITTSSEVDSSEYALGSLPTGRGLSTMTRPTA